MNSIQQAVIKCDNAWRQTNNQLLAQYVGLLIEGQTWPALVTFAQWGISEQRCMAVWKQNKAELHLPDPGLDALAEEEGALLLLLEKIQAEQRAPYENHRPRGSA